MLQKSSHTYLLLIVASAILFIPFIGGVHLFDWDEINFAEAAREMLVTKNYLHVQIDYHPFWEKPPLFIWMQALSMSLFGVNEFASRLPNALAGIVTICCLFHIGKKTVSIQLGWIWALLYAASWLPHLYFRSGIIDPWFNLFIFLSLYQFWHLGQTNQPLRSALLSGLYLGLAVMTKGPVALLVVGAVGLIYLIVYRKHINGYKFYRLALLACAAIITLGLWFAIDIIKNGWWFVEEFVRYQIRLLSTEDAGHGGPFFYHFIVLLIGCFPASAFLFQYLKKQSTPAGDALFRKMMWWLFWFVLILFSVVKTKIVHYSSLCYLPLTYLAALQINEYLKGNLQWNKWTKGIFIFGIIFWSLVLVALPIIGLNKEVLIPLIKDPFAVGNLQAQVPWHFSEVLIGLVYALLLVLVLKFFHQKHRQQIIALAWVQFIFITITLVHFTPKIEAYSQNAAIQFYQSFQGQNVYVKPLGFKSFAHLFYTQKQPGHASSIDVEWLLNEPTDKPVYFICKNIHAKEFESLPQLEKIGEQNGFVFFKRKL